MFRCMKIFFTIITFFGFSCQLSAQEVQGRVTASTDSLPIEGAHIVNTTQNRMAISDQNGWFYLVVKKGDTLVASNINFNSKQFVVKSTNHLSISLNPAIIQLEEVQVSNLPETEADFRRKLIGMGEIEDRSFVPFGMKPNSPKGRVPKNYDPDYTNSLGYAINKPISFIVKKISKKHKNELKYHQIVANQEKKITSDKKYNPKIVKELTGLEENDLIDFMHYLDIDPAFVSRSSDYEIAARILKAYDEYKAQKG